MIKGEVRSQDSKSTSSLIADPKKAKNHSDEDTMLDIMMLTPSNVELSGDEDNDDVLVEGAVRTNGQNNVSQTFWQKSLMTA